MEKPMLLFNVTGATAKNPQFFIILYLPKYLNLTPLSMSYKMHIILYMKIAPVIFGILVLTPTMIERT